MPGDRRDLGAPTGPSGWAPDPWRRHHARFFDGRQWTEHVADGGVASVDSAPVADMPRSRPVPPDQAPPDGQGPRVLDEGGVAVDDPGLAGALLLLDLVADRDGVRRLRTPTEADVGRVVAPAPSLPARLGRLLVSAPATAPTHLVVADTTGATHVELRRPGRRTAATVDVTGPDGAAGTVVATSIRRGLEARVLAPSDEEVGRLEQVGPDTGSLRVVTSEGTVRARLTPVWDVPGSRHHLPPGVVLVDRRPPDGGVRADEAHGDLLLGALLAPLLLLPPAAPPDR